MIHASQAETVVLQHLTEKGGVTLEELMRSLSQFTFDELFSAIDRLSREGRLLLARPTRFGYTVSRKVFRNHCAMHHNRGSRQ